MINRASRRRSVVKAITYRGIIVVLDFNGDLPAEARWPRRAGFMVISNIYMTVAYFLHERVWSGIKWGLEPQGGN